MRATQLKRQYGFRFLTVISLAFPLGILSACSSDLIADVDDGWENGTKSSDELTLHVSTHDDGRLIVRSSSGHHGAVADGVYLMTVQADRGTISVMEVTRNLNFELVESRPAEDIEPYCLAIQEEAVSSAEKNHTNGADRQSSFGIEPLDRQPSPSGFYPDDSGEDGAPELPVPQGDDSFTPELPTAPNHQELKI